MKKRIVLTGFMGVGKTAVGKQLAKRLGVEFYDTDDIIEQEEGKTIAEIFDGSGEDYFRKREAEVFKRLIETDSAVISTGGGTFENADVRRLAKEKAVSVCLVSSVEGLLKRIERLKGRRPMLKDKTAGEIRTLYAKRAKSYADCDLFVRVEGLQKHQVAKKVLELLEKRE